MQADLGAAAHNPTPEAAAHAEEEGRLRHCCISEEHLLLFGVPPNAKSELGRSGVSSATGAAQRPENQVQRLRRTDGYEAVAVMGGDGLVLGPRDRGKEKRA